ncbi:MAG: gliding motility-associated C-terminal domain-containing protein [Bacteroidota bacterium]
MKSYHPVAPALFPGSGEKCQTPNFSFKGKHLKSLLFVALFCCTSLLQAQSTFRLSYDIASFDLAGGMVESPTGDFVFAGTNATFIPLYGNVTKVGPTGTVIWSKAYAGGIATDFWDLKKVSTGGYIMAGSSSGSGAILVRIDDNGNLLWAKRYSLPNRPADDASNEYAQSVMETSDGGFLVGGGVDYFWDGVSGNTVDTTSAFGFKVNSAGVLQWSRVWTIATANPDEHYINDVAESSNGYFFVGESSEGSGTLNSDGDYPRNALLIKTDFSGNLIYSNRWGTGNANSEGINCALRVSTGDILLGGYDNSDAFLFRISGTAASATTGTFNIRMLGASFPPDLYVIQDIMQNSDGNYSVIGWRLTGLVPTFYSSLFKFNAASETLMLGKGYPPVGLSSILPEGGLAADQGYYMVMTDQQMTGFNYSMIRTDANGDLNDPDAGCAPTNIAPALSSYDPSYVALAPGVFNLAAENTFTPVVTNLTPVKTEHCLTVVCTPPATPTAGATSLTICNGQSTNLTASGGSNVTYEWFTVPTGGTAFATGTPVTVSPTTTTTYYVQSNDNTNPGCVSARASVTITVVQPPNAGTNGTASFCSNSASANLFSSLGGTPQAGGTWTGPSALGGGSLGTYNPATCAPGVYTYTVTGTAPCANASATVTVTENTAPNAGTNGSITLCSNGAAVNLFSSLGGTPSGGGTWTGPSALTGGSLGTFTPGTNTAGTYTYTVAGTAPCANATATVTVTVNTAANAGSNGTATFCSNGAAANLFSSLGGTPQAGGTWTGPSALTGGSLGTFTPGTNTAGTYTYTVTGTAPCTNATATVTVTVNTAPNAGTNGTAAFCSTSASANLFSSLGGTPSAGGTWTGPSALGGGSLGTYNPATCAPGTYTYTVTGTAPCANATATVTVTENTAPNAGTNGTATFCSNSASANLFSSLGGTPSAGGTWTGPSALGGGSLGTYNPATCAPGTYTYTVTGTAPCTNATATVTVTENTAPNAGTNGSVTVCSNGSAVNLFSSLGGTPSAGGTWSGPSALTGGSLGTFTPGTNTAGTYTYTVTGTAPCANATATVTVTINTAPNAGTNGTASVCSNGSAINLFSSLGGTPSGSGTWSGPSALTGGSLGTFTPGTNTAGTYTYTVTGTAPCANATATVTVTVNNAPASPTVTPTTDTICQGQSTTINASGTGGATFNVYDAASSGTLLGTTPLTVSPTSTTTYYVEAVSTAGCINSGGTVATTITVLPVADPSWTSPGATCIPAGPINLDALVTGTSGGTWSGTGVTGSTFDPTGLGGQTINITYSVGTAPCVQTSTQSISVQSVITASWTSPGTMCESDGMVNLNSLITGTAGGTWSGTGVTGNSFDPTGLSGTVSITYTVGVSPCQDAVTQDIIVNSSPLDPTVAATDTSICAGESVTITASGSGGGVTYNVYDAAAGGNLLGTTPLTLTPGAGTYTYYVEAENSNGCINLGGRDDITIVVNALPVADAGTDQQICPGDAATLTATGGGNYLWSTTETTASISVSPASTQTYSVLVTNTAGCTDTDSVTVTIYNAGALNANDDSTSVETTLTVTVDAAANDGGTINTVTILSGPSNGTANVSGTNVTYDPNNGYIGNDTIVYTICDAFCSTYCDTAIIVIRVTEEIVIDIPDGFSPNGDGINDEFVIPGLSKYPENELWIYNRWGELIFHAKPYNNDWGGETNNPKRVVSGDEVIDGTYFYILKLTPSEEALRGSLELRRQ